MKKFFLLLLLAGCAASPYYGEPEMRPGQSEHMDVNMLFDENGCLITDIMEVTDNDRLCLDPDNTGCVTRKRWDAFMEYWSIHTPEPEIPLCEQMML